MSMKDNKHYRPRHTRGDGDGAKIEKSPQTPKRSFNEQKLRTGSESAKDMFPERVPAIPQKKSVIARRVNITSLEEQPKAAAVTPDESEKTAESLVTAERPEVAEAPVVAETPETAPDPKATESTEDTQSAQQEESADAAGSSNAEEKTADEAQDGAREADTDAAHTPDDGEEPEAEEAAVAVSVMTAAAEEEAPEQKDEEADDHSHEPEEQPRKKKKKWKGVLIAVVAIPLAIIIALLGTFFVMREIGRKNIHANKQFEMTLPTQSSDKNEVAFGDRYGRIINYKGDSYVFNNDIAALTLIGVDNGHGPDKDLKMADAIYVLAINTKNGKVKILNISRDIITDVNVYSQEGAFIDTERIQIAYSNAYCEKGSTGGYNTNTSVSRLMFGLPMENYFEINLNGVTTLNDAVGGVKVTSALTFTSPEDGRTINEGEEVTLHGREAEYYVRRRDITELESNNDRMQRQQEYIMSFLGSIIPEAKKNPGIIPDLYSAIKQNSETSLKASELIYFASSAIANIHSLSDIEIVKFDGEITKGINAEMHVSDDEILSKMLDIFYVPLGTSVTEVSENTDASSAAAAQPAATQAAAATTAQ